MTNTEELKAKIEQNKRDVEILRKEQPSLESELKKIVEVRFYIGDEFGDYILCADFQRPSNVFLMRIDGHSVKHCPVRMDLFHDKLLDRWYVTKLPTIFPEDFGLQYAGHGINSNIVKD